MVKVNNGAVSRPYNEVKAYMGSSTRDLPLSSINRMFSACISVKPLSQFDEQVFNPRDAYGCCGADKKLVTLN